MPILRSKIALVLFGALLIGAVGGTLAAFSAAPPSTAAPGPALAQASATASASSSSADATATSTAGNPTTPIPTPTRTIRPTPTTPPIGAPVDLHGRVASKNVNDNTFVLSFFGGSMTCQVSPSTTWPNSSVGSVSSLQLGMQAEVQGTYQGNGLVTASVVDAQIDN